MRRRLLACVVAGALLAACGSDDGEPLDVAALIDAPPTSATTVPVGAAGTPAPDGAAGEQPLAPGGAAGPTPGAAGAPTGSAGPTGGTGANAGGTAAGPSTGAAGPPLLLGVHYSEDLQAAYGALGASDAEPDVDAAVPLVVEHLNANGGIGGRPVELFFHGSNPLDGTFDAQSQAACEAFDEAGVFAVISGAVMPSIVLPDCLARRGIPFVWNYHYLVDEATWQEYRPNLYMPFSINADRLGGVYVDVLADAGYFDDAAVGIVRYDNPQHQRFTTQQLRPALDAVGANVVEEVALGQPSSAAAAGDTATQISAAILRLRSAGVTHVLFVPTGGAVPFIFMTQADSQGFRPRYAMNTLDIPTFVNDQAGPSQLRGALAVGWSPASDVDRPDEPPSQPRELCYALTDSTTAQRYCDALFFLDAALDRAPSLDAAGLRAGVEALGSSFDPVFSLRTVFGPGRHDGASAVQLVAYEDGCECFRYRGPIRDIG